MVLGNHDLHLLAIARGCREPTSKDTLDGIINHSDTEDLIGWLQKQPVLIHEHGYILVHAGIPPHWSLATAILRASEVEAALRGDQASEFFLNMYGNQPDHWRSNQRGKDKLRVITNYLTRMRFCDANGNMELECKLAPEKGPAGYLPWYAHNKRKTANEKIIFGHWAALNGQNCGEKLFPLDTGCVWGGRLRLLNLETGNYIHCDC
jgi:bis(5'-nucleosyl)-tetraphosphatase (symmetrical)